MGADIQRYTEDELTHWHSVATAIAPWVRGGKNTSPMNQQEVGLAIRKSLNLGLDPLNGSEVQIWKDNRGTINVEYAYELRVEWVNKIYGEHTEPIYERLSEDELMAEGLTPTHIAYRCRLIPLRNLDKMVTLSNIYGAEKARAMFEVTGIGVADAGEYSGSYFAPSGRSKSWKVKKRALVDALRRKYGDPPADEIRQIRGYEVDPEASARAIEVAGDMSPDGMRAMVSAEKTRGALAMSDEDKGAAKSALFGGAAASVAEGDFTESEEVIESLAPAEAAGAEDYDPAQDVAEAQAELEASKGTSKHWIDDPTTRKKFWAWASDNGLSKAEVHEALKVESVHDFAGAKADAVHLISAWTDAKTEEPEQPPVDF